jgi:hypothetical protein
MERRASSGHMARRERGSELGPVAQALRVDDGPTQDCEVLSQSKMIT